MLDSARKAIIQAIPDINTGIILAVSGGVDSMLLLRIIRDIGYTRVTVAHIQHGLRADASQDATLVKKISEKYGCTYMAHSVDIGVLAKEHKRNIEDMGREVRYAFLENCRKQQDATWILLGHHMDDLIESQLLHAQRGADIFGLVGFTVQDVKRRLLRPLISYSKEEVYAIASELGLEWREDSSNTDTSYRRNYLRTRIIPGLKKKFPDLTQIMTGLSEESQNILTSLYREIESHLGTAFEQQESWAYDAFTTLDTDLRSYALVYILRHWIPGGHYSQSMIMTLVDNITTLQSGGMIELNSKYRIVRVFDRLELTTKPHDTEDSVVSYEAIPDTFIYADKTYTVSTDSKNSIVLVGKKLLQNGFTLRTRQAGDHIVYSDKDFLYHKSLKKLFIERRIPAHQRDTVPLIISRSTQEIIAILHPQSYYRHPSTLSTSDLLYIRSNEQ